MANQDILPAGWDPKAAGDAVLGGLVKVTAPEVKGAHDSDFVIVDGKAHIVTMANDVEPSENPLWPHVYNVLIVVDVASREVEKREVFAASEKQYGNRRLERGACFVPRILRLEHGRLRCFFASEEPGKRQSQTWFTDYDPATGRFDGEIHPAEIETGAGMFPMQPFRLFDDAVAHGYRGQVLDYGLYMIDSFKEFDGRMHAVLNCFPAGVLAWSVMDDARRRFTVLGYFFGRNGEQLTEAAVNRMPDGSFLSVARQEFGDLNYLFSRCTDGGRTWTPNAPIDAVPAGTRGKPVLERFGGAYYLGWQEKTEINGVHRSVFNIDVSRDGTRWERKYRFETEKSFQYPTLREDGGSVYLTVTQGDTFVDRKERLMFGKLEDMAP